MTDLLRPVAGPTTIGVDVEIEVLRELLTIERERLTVARRIEVDRNIVFPETTVIIKDIERLLEKIISKETGRAVSVFDGLEL